jgi:hypothetical protein
MFYCNSFNCYCIFYYCLKENKSLKFYVFEYINCKVVTLASVFFSMHVIAISALWWPKPTVVGDNWKYSVLDVVFALTINNSNYRSISAQQVQNLWEKLLMDFCRAKLWSQRRKKSEITLECLLWWQPYDNERRNSSLWHTWRSHHL